MSDRVPSKSEPRNFTCPHHNRVIEIVPETTGCPECNAFLDNPTDPATMTGGERAAEMRRWGSICTVKFERIHKRIEALVGRDVWTHEMAGDHFQVLVKEAETWEHPENLMGHVVDSLSDMMGGAENVFVYPAAPHE